MDGVDDTDAVNEDVHDGGVEDNLVKMFTVVVWRTTWSRRRMARVELILRKEVAWGGDGSSPT